jgi:hypothetical protein
MCYVDWKGYKRTLSLTIWNTMWIWTDERGWCLDQIESAMWIGKDAKGTFHDKFKIIYALQQTWKNADMT